MRETLKRIAAGDAQAALVFEAMVKTVAKQIGACAAVLEGRVDGIVLTGGLAFGHRIHRPHHRARPILRTASSSIPGRTRWSRWPRPACASCGARTRPASIRHNTSRTEGSHHDHDSGPDRRTRKGQGHQAAGRRRRGEDPHTIEAVGRAVQEKLVHATLTGDEKAIEKVAAETKVDSEDLRDPPRARQGQGPGPGHRQGPRGRGRLPDEGPARLFPLYPRHHRQGKGPAAGRANSCPT